MSPVQLDAKIATHLAAAAVAASEIFTMDGLDLIARAIADRRDNAAGAIVDDVLESRVETDIDQRMRVDRVLQDGLDDDLADA